MRCDMSLYSLRSDQFAQALCSTCMADAAVNTPEVHVVNLF